MRVGRRTGQIHAEMQLRAQEDDSDERPPESGIRLFRSFGQATIFKPLSAKAEIKLADRYEPINESGVG